MALDKTNYINSLWSSIESIFKTAFPSYTIDTKPLTTPTISNSTILILHPRPSRIGLKTNYNDEQRKKFKINIICLADNSKGEGELAAAKMAGEVDYYIERHQDLLSPTGLEFAQIISIDPTNDNFINSDAISGYTCVLQSNVML